LQHLVYVAEHAGASHRVDSEAFPEEVVHDHPVRHLAAVVAEQVVAQQASVESQAERAGHAAHHRLIRSRVLSDVGHGRLVRPAVGVLARAQDGASQLKTQEHRDARDRDPGGGPTARQDPSDEEGQDRSEQRQSMDQVDGASLALPERQEQEHGREQAEDGPEPPAPPDGGDRERAGQARGIDRQYDRLEIDRAGVARRVLLQPEGAQVALAQLGPERRRRMKERLRAVPHPQVEHELGEEAGRVPQDVEPPGRSARDVRSEREAHPPAIDAPAIPREEKQQAEQVDDPQRMAQPGGDDRRVRREQRGAERTLPQRQVQRQSRGAESRADHVVAGGRGGHQIRVVGHDEQRRQVRDGSSSGETLENDEPRQARHQSHQDGGQPHGYEVESEHLERQGLQQDADGGIPVGVLVDAAQAAALLVEQCRSHESMERQVVGGTRETPFIAPRLPGE